MNTYLTQISVYDRKTKEVILFAGQNIEAPTQELAQQYCQENGLGYLEVVGVLVKSDNYNDNYKYN